jgi:hypothetical protein
MTPTSASARAAGGRATRAMWVLLPIVILASVNVAPATVMTVNFTSGSPQIFDVAAVRKITYTMATPVMMNVVLTSNTTQSYDISTVKTIIFTNPKSGVKDRQAQMLKDQLLRFVSRKGAVPAAVRFSVAAAEQVKVAVYNVKGDLVRMVADEKFEPGDHMVLWNGTDNQNTRVAGGSYIMRVDRQGKSQAYKFVTIR